MSKLAIFEKRGYVDIPNTFSSFWKEQPFRTIGKTRTGRKIQNFNGAYSKRIWKSLLTDEIRELLSVMERPAVQIIQKIITDKAQPEQEIHRDHDLGKYKMLTLVFTLNGSPVTTWFHPNSHKDQHKVIYRSVDREKELKEKKKFMIQSQNSAIVYDAFILHAGAETHVANDNQVFVSFVDMNLFDDELEQLNDVSFRKKTAKYIPIDIY